MAPALDDDVVPQTPPAASEGTDIAVASTSVDPATGSSGERSDAAKGEEDVPAPPTTEEGDVEMAPPAPTVPQVSTEPPATESQEDVEMTLLSEEKDSVVPETVSTTEIDMEICGEEEDMALAPEQQVAQTLKPAPLAETEKDLANEIAEQRVAAVEQRAIEKVESEEAANTRVKANEGEQVEKEAASAANASVSSESKGVNALTPEVPAKTEAGASGVPPSAPKGPTMTPESAAVAERSAEREETAAVPATAPSAPAVGETSVVQADPTAVAANKPSVVEAAPPTDMSATSAATKEKAESKEMKEPEHPVVSTKKTEEQPKTASPKRKESVKSTTAVVVNGDAVPGSAPAEPAVKKQKVEKPEAEADATAAVAGDGVGAPPPLMLSRDDMAKMEEDSGKLKFDVISNDGTVEHMIQLTTLKNIFAKQLPKMPKEYIVRLVFDRNHRSMLILKNGTHVIGGICYRPFEPNHFAEIAFCAINASDQVKGYGTRLMNHLKEYVKTKKITHFLTYADNYAIGYFKKQGFTKVVSMPRPNWYGYIKDYDGGTLMECTIHYQINYLRITSMIHMQRKVRTGRCSAIQDKIKQHSHAHIVYPGLKKFADGRLMDIYMVPGVSKFAFRVTRDQGSLKTQLSQLLKAVYSHRSAWPFHEPVDTTIVVDYLEHIKEPMDLQLINKRVESGAYLSKAAFKADLDKMCDNCTTYNTPDTNYYKCVALCSMAFASAPIGLTCGAVLALCIISRAAIDLREFIQTRIQIRDLGLAK
ncbi:hypothetical protein BBJ28_00014277 [Nothophytophthora sp. Chile5]|nr:hypothetical protein BBJ28_00014277 [Nothophytophthora sp. Chile5]